MNKDDILLRSRKEGINELENSIYNKSFIFGFIPLFLAILLFSIVKLMSGEPIYEISAILFAYCAGMQLYSFIKLKAVHHFVASVCFTLAFLANTILFFINR